MSIILDVAFVVFLLIVAIVGFKQGVGNFFTQEIKMVLIILGMFYLAPILVGLVCNNENVYNTISSWIPISDFAKNIVVRVFIYIVVMAIMAIIISVVTKIISNSIENADGDAKTLSTASKILGLVTHLVFYGLAFLTILGIVGTINTEGVNTFLSGSFVYQHNFMNGFCSTYLNFGALIGVAHV